MPEVIQVQEISSGKSLAISHQLDHKQQLLSLGEGGALAEFDVEVEEEVDVETVESLQIMPRNSATVITGTAGSESEDQGKLDFLESKISLLELLLEAKTSKITEQASELAKLRLAAHSEKVSRARSSSSESLVDITGNEEAQQKLQLELDRKLQESLDLQESRRIAASFIHAESLYLDKLDQLQCQIAIERMGHGEAQKQPPSRLFPITGSAPAHMLEETLLKIQKLLKIEPNVSVSGLEITEKHLEKTLEDSNEIIELQHNKIQQVLEEQIASINSTDSASVVLVKELLHIFSAPSFQTRLSSAESKKITDISVSLLSSIQSETRFLESNCNRLEDQLALNLEIKKLMVSVQMNKQNSGLLVHLNDVLKENADLKQQLHLYSASRHQ